MSLLQLDGEDTWLTSQNHTSRLVQELTIVISTRRQLLPGDPQHALTTNKLRAQIPQAEHEIKNLLSGLDGVPGGSLTPWERERRVRVCEGLQSSLQKVMADFKGDSSRVTGRVADLGTTGWGNEDESETTTYLSTDQLLQRNRTSEREQDAGLEALSRVVSQQKRIASAIGNEVDDQNDRLELDEDVDNRHICQGSRIGTLTSAIKKVRAAYWVIIIALAIAIIVVGLWD
ncbi:unnamed protein product, partial [Meganyctiphanes norvegica]